MKTLPESGSQVQRGFPGTARVPRYSAGSQVALRWLHSVGTITEDQSLGVIRLASKEYVNPGICR